MGLAKLQERRFKNRAPVLHLIPGELIEELTGRRLSSILVDISNHGLGVRTQAVLNPGAKLALMTLFGIVPLQVAWAEEPRSPRAGRRYGLMSTDESTDLTELFSSFLQ